MHYFKKTALITFGLALSMNTFASWIEMRLVANDTFKSQGFGNSGWVTCTYSTGDIWGGGNTVTINVTDYSCPYSIQYNPETNQWRR